jgi:hypothetical protein
MGVIVGYLHGKRVRAAGSDPIPNESATEAAMRPRLLSFVFPLLAMLLATAHARAAEQAASSPGLLASTLFGAGGEDDVVDIATGDDGSIYVLLFTLSAHLPTTTGAFDHSYNRPGPGEFGGDAFIARFDPSASHLIYATYLGGTDTEYPHALTVGPDGEAYVTGYTYSPNFPTTAGAYSPTFGGGCCDAFVTALDAAGALQWSTFFGGSSFESAMAIARAASGDIIIAGETLSPDVPTTPGAYDRTLNFDGASYSDAYVARLDASGSSLVWATYLGGSYNDYGVAVDVDTDGRVFVAGRSMAADFPTTPGAYDRTLAGGGTGDGIVTALVPDGSALSYSTYLGGGDSEEIRAIAIAADGSAYVAGDTGSADFPTTPDAPDRTCNSCFVSDAFVSRLDPSGSTLSYSTFLGGEDTDYASDIALLPSGAVLVAGTTYSSAFPTTTGALSRTLGGSADAFLTKLRPGVRRLAYSTFLGGTDFVVDSGAAVAADAHGVALVAGSTHSSDFPVTDGAYDVSYNGDFDGFVSRLRTRVPAPAVSAR